MNAYYFFLWVGGFIITFVASYFFLRLADSKGRLASTAGLLRFTAVVMAMVLIYAWSFDGLNLGSVLAFLVIMGMIMFRKRRD